MLSKKMQKTLNDQINAEMYSGYLYLSMAAYFSTKNLGGMANWMTIQAQEELSHAMIMYNHVNERGGTVELKAIDGPPVSWQKPLDAFKDALAHERKVTGMINKIIDLAVAESDHATNSFMQWFVNEQVEEERNASDNVANLELSENSPQALFMVDREMAQRVFTVPQPLQGV